MLRPNLILAKASPEFTIKSEEVRRHFGKKLASNLRLALENTGAKAEISSSRGRLFLRSEDPKRALAVLKKTFGVNSAALAQETQGNLTKEISSALLGIAKGFLKKGDSFALRVNRVASHELSSQELARVLGKKIMDSVPGLKVDLSAPQKEIFIEVLEGKTIFFTKEEKCAGGLPVGVGGKVGFVFEGKPREFEAALLLMRRGCNVFPIARKGGRSAEGTIARLKEWNCGRELRVHTKAEAKKLGVIGIASAETDPQKTLSRKKIEFELFPLMLNPIEAKFE